MSTNQKSFFWVYDRVTVRAMFSGMFLQMFIKNLREEIWTFAIISLGLSVFFFNLAKKKSDEVESEINFRRKIFNTPLIFLMGYSVAIYILSGIVIGLISDHFAFKLSGLLIIFPTFLIVSLIQKFLCQEAATKIFYDEKIGRCVYQHVSSNNTQTQE